MVPKGYFIDSNPIKTANGMNNRQVTFSALINVALHKCPRKPYQKVWPSYTKTDASCFLKGQPKRLPYRLDHFRRLYCMPCKTYDLSVKVRPWEFGSSPT